MFSEYPLEFRRMGWDPTGCSPVGIICLSPSGCWFIHFCKLLSRVVDCKWKRLHLMFFQGCLVGHTSNYGCCFSSLRCQKIINDVCTALPVNLHFSAPSEAASHSALNSFREGKQLQDKHWLFDMWKAITLWSQPDRNRIRSKLRFVYICVFHYTILALFTYDLCESINGNQLVNSKKQIRYFLLHKEDLPAHFQCPCIWVAGGPLISVAFDTPQLL